MSGIDVEALLAEWEQKSDATLHYEHLGVDASRAFAAALNAGNALASALKQERERVNYHWDEGSKARHEATVARLRVQDVEAENARLQGLVEQARTALESQQAIARAEATEFRRQRNGSAAYGIETIASLPSIKGALAALSATGPTTGKCQVCHGTGVLDVDTMGKQFLGSCPACSATGPTTTSEEAK